MINGLRWNSVRMRLTLLNVAVLALVLGGFGTALCVAVTVTMQQGVDRDLSDWVDGIDEGFQRWALFPPPPMGESGSPRRPGRRERRFELRRPEAPSRPPQPPGGQLTPSAAPTDGARASTRSAGTVVLIQAAPPDAAPDPAPDPTPTPPTPRPEDELRRPRFIRPDGTGWGMFPNVRPWDHDLLAASVAGERKYATVQAYGQPVRIFSAPIFVNGELVVVVQVARSMATMQKFQGGLFTAVAALVPLAVLVAGLGGAFLTGRALQPVRDVTQAAAKIGADDLSQRLKVEGDDEFGELARTFNGMIGRLEEAFAKMEAAYEEQRRFTGDASHELRTPLTTIKANTSLALSGARTVEQYREALEAADRAADTMNRIVQDLLLLTRSDAGTLTLARQRFPIEAPIANALDMVRHLKGAAIELDLAPEALDVDGDLHHLTRLFTNLLENALRHTPADGHIQVAARDELTAEGRMIVVRVTDSGEGIPPQHLPRVCDRFYRVDVARSREGYGEVVGGGTGLGLAICQSIINAHGGEMAITSEVGRGTTVSVRLPSASSPAEPLPRTNLSHAGRFEPSEDRVAGRIG